MVKVSIFRANVETNTIILDSPDAAAAWISAQSAMGILGKVDRWVTAGMEDVRTATETRTVVDVPALPAVLDDSGNVVTPAVDAVTHVEYRLPAEFSSTVTDISAQVAQAQINDQALAYLVSTDWYAVRFAETGVAIPDDIKTARAAARAKIVR